jgi:hypothetical protein
MIFIMVICELLIRGAIVTIVKCFIYDLVAGIGTCNGISQLERITPIFANMTQYLKSMVQ